LEQSASFDASCVQIGSVVWSVGLVTKKKDKVKGKVEMLIFQLILCDILIRNFKYFLAALAVVTFTHISHTWKACSCIFVAVFCYKQIWFQNAQLFMLRFVGLIFIRRHFEKKQVAEIFPSIIPVYTIYVLHVGLFSRKVMLSVAMTLIR
jgi:hypothetical protein